MVIYFKGRFFAFEITRLWREISREALAHPSKLKNHAFLGVSA
jgi:hypothetical protein